jgi:hypothetical protein
MKTYVSCILLLTKSWTYTCIFFTYGIVFMMTGSEQHLVLLEGVLRIIFEELDPIWLTPIWRGPSESYRDLIDIICMLYLLDVDDS